MVWKRKGVTAPEAKTCRWKMRLTTAYLLVTAQTGAVHENTSYVSLADNPVEAGRDPTTAPPLKIAVRGNPSYKITMR